MEVPNSVPRLFYLVPYLLCESSILEGKLFFSSFAPRDHGCRFKALLERWGEVQGIDKIEIENYFGL